MECDILLCAAAANAAGKWKLLNTFDLSSGAVQYVADTTGCDELMIVTTEAASASGQYVMWKGATIFPTMLAEGSVLNMNYLPKETIAWQGRRNNSATDLLVRSEIAEGANPSDNDLVISFQSATAGIIKVWGR